MVSYLEKAHVYTYIASVGENVNRGVSSVVEDDGTMVRSRHQNAFVPFVTAIRDVLVCLQTPIESLMRFQPCVNAVSLRKVPFRVNCGMYDNYTNRNNSNGRRGETKSPSIMESFLPSGRKKRMRLQTYETTATTIAPTLPTQAVVVIYLGARPRQEEGAE